MHALILAGGSGTRLGLGEKALVTVRERPMIGYVVEAFRAAGHECVVVLTEKTPYTRNWCRAHGIAHLTASGSGYIDDIGEAAGVLELDRPFFTCAADLPCLSPGVIDAILDSYRQSGKEACSVWVPERLVREAGCNPAYVEQVDEIAACPAGINILRGDLMTRQQDELRLLLDEVRLVFNVNTRDELASLQALIARPGMPEFDKKA